VKTGFRFSVASRGLWLIWFEPRHPAPSGSGGQAYQYRPARRVLETGV